MSERKNSFWWNDESDKEFRDTLRLNFLPTIYLLLIVYNYIMSAAKRRSVKQGSQTSLTRSDEVELQGRSRPQSATSHKAWHEDGPGQDDVDIGPRNQAALDFPSGMANEPYDMQTQITHDVRAANKTQPVDCWTRLLRAIRSKLS